MGFLRRMDDTGIPLAIVRLVLGVYMIRMGWSKAWDPVGFLKLLHEYEMFPEGAYYLQNMIAVTLPWVEMICGVVLILGLLIRGASATLLVLLTVFTVVIALRALGIHESTGTPLCDIHFDCGCGGGDVHMCRKLPENVGLWLLAWVGLLSRSRRCCLSGIYGVSVAQSPAA